MKRRRKQAGLTLVELIVAFSIMLILSTMALPLARVKVQREKERQLRHALKVMRTAIDRYKDMADAGELGQIDPDTFGYPPSLEILVEGVPVQMGAMGAGMGGGQPGFGTPASQLGGRGSSSLGGGGIGGSSFGNRPGSSGAFGGRGGSAFGGGGGIGGSSFGNRQGGGLGGRQGGGFGNRGSGGLGSGSGSFGNQGMRSEDGERKIRFLRKIPFDPMTQTYDWGVRSVEDDPDSFSWGGGNVFDVFTRSMDVSLDGTRYSEW